MRNQKMMNEALGVLENEKPELELKAVCSRLGKEAYIGGKDKYGDTESAVNKIRKIYYILRANFR